MWQRFIQYIQKNNTALLPFAVVALALAIAVTIFAVVAEPENENTRTYGFQNNTNQNTSETVSVNENVNVTEQNENTNTVQEGVNAATNTNTSANPSQNTNTVTPQGSNVNMGDDSGDDDSEASNTNTSRPSAPVQNTNNTNTERTTQPIAQYSVQLTVGSPAAGTYSVNIPEGGKVSDAMSAARAKGFTYTTRQYGGMGAYVASIGGVSEDTDANMFWVYRVNGVKATVGISGYTLKNGDVISWAYENGN